VALWWGFVYQLGVIMNNMEIWDRVKKTDLKYTKEGGKETNFLTSINGLYCAMRATEVFGICGIGWGWDILEERYDQGVLHKHENGDYHAVTHTIKIKLWFVIGEKRGEIPHFGHTPYIMRSTFGAYMDNEAPKKSLTDAIKKCLSMIGVGADIHLGQMDDQSYKASLVLEAKQERESKKAEKMSELSAEIRKIMMDSGVTYNACKNIAVLKKTHSDLLLKVRQLYEKAGENPEKSIESLVLMFNQQQTKIGENK